MKAFPLAIVTGGAHRVGRAFALTLAYQGFGVLVHYHQSVQQAKNTVNEISTFDVPAFSFQADLSDPGQIAGLFSFVDSLFSSPESGVSRLAILVNSAAFFSQTDIRQLSIPEWDKTMNLNLRAPFLCAQQAARRMTSGDLIVNVSDVGAQKTWSRFPAYSISKAGVEALTRMMARALAPDIRVNAIAPGLVLPGESISQSEWDRLVNKLPMRRPAKTEEVASALEYIIKNRYLTGQTIVVDGGYSLI